MASEILQDYQYKAVTQQCSCQQFFPCISNDDNALPNNFLLVLVMFHDLPLPLQEGPMTEGQFPVDL